MRSQSKSVSRNWQKPWSWAVPKKTPPPISRRRVHRERKRLRSHPAGRKSRHRARQRGRKRRRIELSPAARHTANLKSHCRCERQGSGSQHQTMMGSDPAIRVKWSRPGECDDFPGCPKGLIDFTKSGRWRTELAGFLSFSIARMNVIGIADL